ncbi:MAG: extracellular solute-binding protein [Trueperaceae bacterium]|nr:extracellular solute-binding protein [Trueperaceae bacterium]
MKRLFAPLVTALLLFSFAHAQTQITIGVFPDLDSHLNNVLPMFEAQHPDIDVEVRVLQHGDHHNTLVTALATGSGAPDVVAVDVGFIARFVAEGGLVDLAQEPYNAGQYRDIFAEYAWLQASTTDGRQVAMPTDLGPGVMYYRRDNLAAVDANIDDAITDWETFLALGRTVTRDTDGDGQTDVYLLADAGDVARIIFRSNLAAGEGVFFDAEGNVLVNSERFHEGFRIAREIREAGMDAQIGAWTNEWYEAFKRGTVTVQLSGAWLLGHFQNWMAPETAGLWGASNLPDGIYGSWGGSFYGIPEQSQNKEAAWELVQFLTTNPDIQLAAFQTIGAFPAVTSTYSNDLFSEPLAFLDGQPARLLFAEVAQNIAGVATNPNDQIAQEIVDSALSQVLDEGRSIEAALAEAEQLIARRTRR